MVFNEKKVALVAVSKKKSVECIRVAYEKGQRLFGENRVQELCWKQNQLPNDIKWHFIGHLQTNKVKKIVNIVSLIQSVDSVRLLKTIHREAEKCGRIVDCLLQVRIATENTKYGFLPVELEELIDQNVLSSLNCVRVVGFMGMATLTENIEKIREEFKSLRLLYEKTSHNFSDDFNVLSMGMSGDYKIAIEEGANMVRIGRCYFNEIDC